MKKLLTMLGVILLLTVSISFSQEQTGNLLGVVVDDQGVPLPGVNIEATSPVLIGKVTTMTDELGRFRLLNLPPGTYTVTFSLSGFNTLKREGIIVRLGRTFDLRETLTQTTEEETITVFGKSPVVDIKESGTTFEISQEMFTKLPKGRNFITMVTIASGVNDEREFQPEQTNLPGRSQGLSIDGASSSENMFFVDGVNTTHMYTGDPAQQVMFEFVDEVQVKSSGYEAEYGGSMGGVINVVTRSGGNEFHGELIGYYSGSFLDTTPRKVLRINPLDNTIGEYIEYGDSWPENYIEDDLNRFEFGVGVGGYLIKDRIWFYGSFLPTITTTDREGHFLSDRSKDGTFRRNEYWYRASGKLTAQPISSLRLSGSFTVDPYRWKGDLPEQDGASNPDKNWADTGFRHPGITISARADYIPLDNLLFSATGGYFRTNVVQSLGPDAPRYRHIRTNAGLPFSDQIPPELIRARDWFNLSDGDSYQTLNDIQDRFTANFDTTWYLDLFGEHVWKVGLQFERIRQEVNDAYLFDYFRFYWGDDWSSPNLGTVPTTFGYLEAREPFGVVADINSNRWAFFAQDSWTILDRLTLNVGLRLEREDIPSFADEVAIQAALAEDPPRDIAKDPVSFDFFEKIAPRLGFAYDVWGDARLKVFGSFGLYYDVMKLEMAEGSYGGFQWISHYYDLTTLDWLALQDQNHPVTDGSFLPYIESLNWRIPSFDSTQPDTGEDEIKPYSKIEYTFGVQQRLWEDVSLTARFLHNRVLWAIEDIGFQTAEGELYFNGNPGSDWINGLQDDLLGTNYPDQPKAKRDYYSVDVGIDKRFSNNWMGGIHYTWSYLWGNFSGLASSDETRKSPNVERYFDAWFMHFDQNLNEATGKLPTDRPHQFKIFGAYSFDFGLTVGASAFGMSGTPKTLEFELNENDGFYPLGRFTYHDPNTGALVEKDRNPFLWSVDLYAEYNLKITDRYAVQVNVNVTNVFDQDITLRHFHLINQEVIYTTDAEKLAGFDYQDVIAANNVLGDPRYMMPWSFQAPLTARVGIKFIF